MLRLVVSSDTGPVVKTDSATVAIWLREDDDRGTRVAKRTIHLATFEPRSTASTEGRACTFDSESGKLYFFPICAGLCHVH